MVKTVRFLGDVWPLQLLVASEGYKRKLSFIPLRGSAIAGHVLVACSPYLVMAWRGQLPKPMKWTHPAFRIPADARLYVMVQGVYQYCDLIG